MRHAIKLLVWLLLAASAWPQHWVNPNVESHRIDLRDLGYPEVNQIPENSSAITSLIAASSGKIYGGTSGDQAYLFVYDPSINKVRHLGQVAGAEGIHHSLVEDSDGFLYIGTGKNILRPVELTKRILPGSHGVDRTLWNDIQAVYAGYAGGHLYRYNPRASDGKILMPRDSCPLEDLGVPVAGSGIYALAISPETRRLYGITYPGGHLFEYDVAAGKFRDLGELDDQVVFHGPERDWRSLPRALACDAGRVYTSGAGGYLVVFDILTNKIQSTGLALPGEYYPVQAYTGHPVLEAIVKAPEGGFYGGSSDGFLFFFDPGKKKLTNLGKPRISRRLRALTVGKNGLVYLVAGERDEPCRLFSYDPRGGGFRDLGVVAVDRSPYYSWRGYQFDSMATGPDSTIYLGESERRSHLFLYLP